MSDRLALLEDGEMILDRRTPRLAAQVAASAQVENATCVSYTI